MSINGYDFSRIVEPLLDQKIYISMSRNPRLKALGFSRQKSHRKEDGYLVWLELNIAPAGYNSDEVIELVVAVNYDEKDPEFNEHDWTGSRIVRHFSF